MGPTIIKNCMGNSYKLILDPRNLICLDFDPKSWIRALPSDPNIWICFARNTPRGSVSHFSILTSYESLICFAFIGLWASKFARQGCEDCEKRIRESQVIHLSVRKPNLLAEIRKVTFLTNQCIFSPEIDFV